MNTADVDISPIIPMRKNINYFKVKFGKNSQNFTEIEDSVSPGAFT